MGNRILITGGSGFIGTNAVEFYISRGYGVVNIDIKPPQEPDHEEYWKEVDILDLDKFQKVVEKFNPECVIHLAARANLTGNSLEDYAANIDGVENLIKIGNQVSSIKKIVFASTVLVCKRGYIPKNDEDYCPPVLYGESKMIGEKLVRKLSENFEWVIVRPTSIWGPWFGPTYRRFFEMIRDGKYFNFTGKMSTKTYGYVGNTVYQIDCILNSDSTHGNTYFLGDYEPTDIREWSHEIADEYDKRVKTVPRSLIFLLAKIGDLLQKLNVKFPMTTFRFKNMTTNGIKPLEETRKIAPDLKFSRSEGNKRTIEWLENQSN